MHIINVCVQVSILIQMCSCTYLLYKSCFSIQLHGHCTRYFRNHFLQVPNVSQTLGTADSVPKCFDPSDEFFPASLLQTEKKTLTTQRDNSRRKVTELSKKVEQLEADLEKKKNAITRFEVSVMHVTILSVIATSNV